ncbi:prepilin-type N-terminal cleavage/methylation domain-containing protein [Acinetobacter gyllenbergii]|uniref:pilin n=1 Tax=Acinetobacter gyllenbergii TaxID=134534 RepID=UPI003AF9F7F4
MQKGFTLIEIMIVTAIIGVLASIAVPAYIQYVQKANIQSCMYEVKGYSNSVITAISAPEYGLPNAPVISACANITNAMGWTAMTMQKIIATTKAPANKTIECDLPAGTSCRVLP